MPKDCFVVGPIGAADSPVRIHADWLLEEIISPVMQGYPEFVVHRADKLSQPGLIDTQVITHLLNDDLVIADITTLNPNAFYEIGIRHMAQKPIIHMHKTGEKIPFDISAYRSIEFSLERPNDLRDARSRLKGAVEAVLTEGYRVDNPVTHARGVVRINETASDRDRVLLDEMKSLKDKILEIETSIKPIDRPYAVSRLGDFPWNSSGHTLILKEDNLRARSAARPISAMLSEREARRLAAGRIEDGDDPSS